MATYHKKIPNVSKKKISISYVIRQKDERCHRSGINSLEYDPKLNRLYSAGRDSVIRIWNLSKEDSSSSGGATTSTSNEYDNQTNLPSSSTSFLYDGQTSTANNITYQRQRQHIHPNNDYFLQSMEHHTDWVNDITLCCDGRNLISVSNDTTIKVWDAHQAFCSSTLRSHKDYAKCLAYAKDKEVVASAGFDRMIYLYDIQSLTMLTATKNTVTTKPLDGSKNSIYSLAINQIGTLVASGSTEKVIRLWDPRTRQKLLKLRGHTDNVRSLLFSKDGSLLLSGGSDGTVRLWSIAQQRCISIVRVHDEGVWTLQTNESFSTVYSGGKDCKIFMTDLKDSTNSVLVCQETAPILKILLVDNLPGRHRYKTNNSSSLWVATTDSSLKNWSLVIKPNSTTIASESQTRHIDRLTAISSSQNPIEVPMNREPNLIIKGNPAVIHYQILNDKRHILTRESDNSVALYDVLTARKIEWSSKPAANQKEAKEIFDEELKQRSKMIYVPNWFTVDLKIGLICIHLEESECFAAWVSARDYGFISQDETQDPKVNLGCLMLQALLEHWPPTYEKYENEMKEMHKDLSLVNADDSLQYNKSLQSSINYRSLIYERNQSGVSPQNIGNQYFSIEHHVPIIISEGNQTLLRFLSGEASNNIEDSFLQEIIPVWIAETVIFKCQPKFTKIPFFLLPHPNSGIKSLRKERLSASDMLQIKKVIEHVCEKMLVNIVDENGISTNEQEQNSSSNKTGSSTSTVAPESVTFPYDKVELYCNDQMLDETMDLRTVKHYIWKTGGDLVLHYMPIK